MTIYFSAALAQQEKFGNNYHRIVRHLERQGHQVFQDITTSTFKEAISISDQKKIQYYQQVLEWIQQAEVIVVEVSFPSTLHIGHEISLAIDKNKPVVALYHQECEPTFFLGLQHPLVFWQAYDLVNLEKQLVFGLISAKDCLEVRYNLRLSHRHYSHIADTAKKKRVPKSAYIRKLIEDDMKKR